MNAKTRGAPYAKVRNLSAKVTNVTNVNPENSSDKGAHAAHEKAATGMPLRGVAMVLIAVAVMLGLWGLYSLSFGGSDKESTSATSDATATAPTQGGSPTASSSASPAAPAGDGASNTQDNEGGQAPAPAATDEQAPAAGGGTGAGAGTAQRDRADIKVAVLNNSGESGKANVEAERLKGDGFNVGYVGNLPGDIRTVPKTTVFYPGGDADAESLAREVAAFYQADATPIEGEFPAEATADNGVIVALAIPQA